jgi:hypothetical protein
MTLSISKSSSKSGVKKPALGAVQFNHETMKVGGELYLSALFPQNGRRCSMSPYNRVLRGVILTATLTTLAPVALADDHRSQKYEIRQDRRELRESKQELEGDRNELKQDRREYQQDKRSGANKAELARDKAEIRESQENLRDSRRDVQKDWRELKRDLNH